jgi:hemoglobin
MGQSLFEHYGGFSAVRRVVSAFYDAVLDSEELGPYFADSDVRRLIDHQTKFIASLLGGPAAFSDEHLQRVHAHLPITRADFDVMAAILRDVLEDADFAPDDVDHVVNEMGRRANVIVK